MRISKSLVLLLMIAARCSAVPLCFEERDPGHFLARFGNATAQLYPNRVILPEITLRFAGADGGARMEGLGPSAPSTYLHAGFRRTFPQFPKLAIHHLYPGVEAVFYGSGENLEYDLKIAGGVSPNVIRISLDGARDVYIDQTGDLRIATASGILQQMRPRVFQRNREISARYLLLAANEVGIRLGKHDPRIPLTIDPVLAYVRRFGSSGSSGANAIALDAQGNIYVAGQSNSADFPTTSNSFEPKFASPLEVLSNAGQTITSLPIGVLGPVTAVSGTPDGAIIYAATSSGIVLSVDGGATWRQTAPLPIPATVNSIAIDPLDPATVLLATNRGVFGSPNAGQFWGLHNTGFIVSGTGSPSVSSVFYNPVNPLIAYAATSNPFYVFASADAGGSWRQLNPTYPGEPPPRPFSFLPGTAVLSPDGGTLDGGTLYVINSNGTLLKTADGGSSWTKLVQGLFGPTAFGPITLIPDPSNPNTLYVLTQLGLQKSSDGGQTFSRLLPPTNARQFTVDSSGALYVAALTPRSPGGSQISVSTDGGNTFTVVPHLTSSEFTALTAFAGNVYVSSSSASVPFVMKLDPSGSNILYSTFLGGSLNDHISAVAVDSQGNAVVVGTTASPDFPLTLPPVNPPGPGNPEAFVAKLSADGTHLIYSIALSGSKSVAIQAVALDSSGAVFVTGQSRGPGLPTTPNAFQPTIPATTCSRPQANLPVVPVNTGNYAFVTKISPDGSSLLYSTYLTGSCGSSGQGVALDAAGDAVVVGSTTSPDFPVSPNSYQSVFPGNANQPSPPGIFNAGFVTKLSPAGDKILASSFLGGGYATDATAVALDPAGNAYITGVTPGFLTGATPGVYQTTAVDRCAPTFFIGPSLPNTGTQDAFVLKLDPTLSTARFLTYLGGSCSDSGSNIALDADGNIWVSGSTSSPDFPLKDPFEGLGLNASFVSELSPDASQLLFSSRTDGTALALNSAGIYAAGASGASVVLAKIDPTRTPAVHIDSIAPVVGFPPTVITPFAPGVAPGLLIQLSGRNLGPAGKVSAQLDASGRLPFILSNTIVFFDNVPAPLLSVQASSIECVAPFEIAETTQITVSSNGQRSNAVRTGVTTSAPEILTIVNQDGTLNSADHPAKTGSVITIYVSGLGETNPPSADGLVNAAPLPVPQAQVTIYLPPGPPINPEAAIAAPGLIAGITQVNARLPASTVTTANKTTINVNTASAPLYVAQ